MSVLPRSGSDCGSGALIAALALALLAAGCGEADPPVGPPGLAAPPDLDRLSPGIREQYRELRRRWSELRDAGAAAEQLAEAWGDLGHWHQLYKYPDSARVCFVEARGLAPGEPRWPYFLAVLDAGRGALDAARGGFERVLELRPDALAARVRLAELEQAARPERAGELFREAFEQDPGCLRARYGLGRLALEEGELEAAIALLEAALAEAPEAPAVHYALGQAYGRAGDAGRAERHLQRVPEDNRTWGPVPLDDPWMGERQRLNLSTRALRRRAARAAERGQLRRAAAIYGRAVAVDPELPRLRVAYARALDAAGEAAAAREQLRETLRRSPGYPLAHRELGTALALERELAAAEEHLRAAVAGDPDDLRGWLQLGRLLRARGRLEEALDCFARVRRRSPGARFWHGALLSRLGRHAEALRAVEEDLGQWPGERTALLAARLLAAAPEAELRDGARALELALGAVAEGATLSAAETVAMAYAELGRFEAAAAWQGAAATAAEAAGERALRRARRRLALYQRRRPCRGPWERAELPLNDPVTAPAGEGG